MRLEPGSDVDLKCQAYGIPKPTFHWIYRQNDTIISNDHTLSLKNIKADDEGYYACVAQNTIGFAMREVRVLVIGGTTNNASLKLAR